MKTLPCNPPRRSSLVAPTALALALGACCLLPTAASATSIGGWGDTGWNHYDKRECCEDAVWLAQEDAAGACEATGGHAKIRSGTSRGICDWDARGNSRDRVYRCTAKTDVYCR